MADLGKVRKTAGDIWGDVVRESWMSPGEKVRKLKSLNNVKIGCDTVIITTPFDSFKISV